MTVQPPEDETGAQPGDAVPPPPEPQPEPRYGQQAPGWASPPSGAGHPDPGHPGAATGATFGPGGPVPPLTPGTVADGFGYGWEKFQRVAGPFILGQLAYFGAVLVVGIVFLVMLFSALAAAASSDDAAPALLGLGVVGVGGAVALLVLVILGVLLQAAVVHASLEVTAGRPVTTSTFFRLPRLGTVALASALVGVLTFVGGALFYAPGLVFAFFAQFTLFFVIGAGQGPIDALRSSFTMVTRNIGIAAVLFLLVMVAGSVGSAVCGIGVLVTTPLSMLATAWVFRRLLGQVPAP